MGANAGGAPPRDSTAGLSATLLIASLALAGVAWAAVGDRYFTTSIFLHLFARYDFPAAVASLAVLAVAVWLSSRLPVTWVDAAVAAVGRRPALAGVLTTAACAAGSLLAYRVHPLSMDEYLPLFQARVFASGSLWARLPPDWVEWVIPGGPANQFFVCSAIDGRAVSGYWPGMALVETPFAALGVPWLLNPLATGLAVWLLAGTARVLADGDPLASGWAVLLAVASPLFLVNGMTLYSMPLHLTANLIFARLLLEPTSLRLFLAGVVGSVALVLHNPVPHAAFALSWLVALAWGPGRVGRLGRLAAGYLPLFLFLGVGWLWLRAQVSGDVARPSGGLLESLRSFGGDPVQVLVYRTIGFAKIVVWSAPVLPALALLGARVGWDRPGVRLWAWSAVVTLVVYLPVRFDQGHGWGYRYFHSAWAALPLLAAVGLARHTRGPDAATLRCLAGVTVALGLALLVPQRVWQVEEFLRGHLAQVPAPDPTRPGWPVVFVDLGAPYYRVDLIQNWPDLSRPPWSFVSHGPEADEAFVRKIDPAAVREWADEHSSLWRIDPEKARLDPNRGPVP